MHQPSLMFGGQLPSSVKIDVIPVPKPRMTRADKWKKRPATDRYWHFKDELKRKVTGELEPFFMIIFHVPMPTSWSKKKRAEMLGQPHQQKPDVDNYLKAFLDAICIEDSYVYRVDAGKYWANEGSIELIEKGGNSA